MRRRDNYTMSTFLIKVHKWLLVLIGIPAFVLLISHQTAFAMITDNGNGTISATTAGNQYTYYEQVPHGTPFSLPYINSQAGVTATISLNVGDYDVYISYCSNILGALCATGINDIGTESYEIVYSGSGFATINSIGAIKTQFISITPLDGQVIATTSQTSVGLPVAQYPNDPNGVSYFCTTTDCSNGLGLATTSLHWTGYVNPDDFATSSTYIQVLISPSGTGFTGQSTYNILIPNSGSFDISTTSAVIYGGGNKMDASIVTKVPNVNFSCLWGILDCLLTNTNLTASSTIFQVGGTSLSPSDQHYLQTLGTPQGLKEGLQAMGSTTAQLAQACNPFSGFDVGKCISGLIIPADTDLNFEVNTLHNLVLSRAPFGWISRILSFMTSGATTTLPVLSYTFQSDSPLAGKDITFDTGAYMQQASAIVANAKSDVTGDQKNVWQIMEPIVDLLLWLVVLFGIIHDVSGLHLINNRH